jgi:hypothetical protein
MRQRVTDRGDPKRYRTEIPNIVLTLGLSPYELSLYVHLKRTAGAEGICWKSTATLAKETGMSSGMVSKAKMGLQRTFDALRGTLITVSEEPNKRGGKPNHMIAIADVWPQNMARFASSHDEVEAEPSSPHERASSYSEVTSSPGEIRKEPIRKERQEEEEPTAHSRLMNFLSLKIGPIPNGAKEGKAIKWLLENGYDPVQCEACFEYLASEGWRTSAVTWVTVKASIGAWLARNGNGRKGKQTASERNVSNIQDSLDYLNSLPSDERMLLT